VCGLRWSFDGMQLASGGNRVGGRAEVSVGGVVVMSTAPLPNAGVWAPVVLRWDAVGVGRQRQQAAHLVASRHRAHTALHCPHGGRKGPRVVAASERADCVRGRHGTCPYIYPELHLCIYLNINIYSLYRPHGRKGTRVVASSERANCVRGRHGACPYIYL